MELKEIIKSELKRLSEESDNYQEGENWHIPNHCRSILTPPSSDPIEMPPTGGVDIIQKILNKKLNFLDPKSLG